MGELVAAGGGDSPDASAGNFSGVHGGVGRGGGGSGGVWGADGSADDYEEEWGMEYAWSAQGGTGRHQAPTLVDRMPQAICTNYLRVRLLTSNAFPFCGRILRAYRNSGSGHRSRRYLPGISISIFSSFREL